MSINYKHIHGRGVQYERGLKMAQEIEWAIKAKKEVERFLAEKG